MNWGISGQLHTTRFEDLGYGEEIAPTTLSKMRAIINQSVRNYYVRRWAEKIVERVPYNDYQRVQAIYDFLATHLNYVRDPFGVELLKTPPVSLQLIEVGDTPGVDCDDMVILSLSLLKSIGYPTAMRAAGYKPNRKLTHVYGMVKVKGQWIPFDLVKSQGLGWEPPGATRITDMEV